MSGKVHGHEYNTSIKLLANMPSSRCNPHMPTPTHIFLCATCCTNLNLEKAFRSEIDTLAGPPPLPSVSAGTDAEPPSMTSTSESDVLPKPPDYPIATIITLSSMMLSPKVTLDKDRRQQHVYEFGDVSIVLDLYARKLGSYDPWHDANADVQRHAVYATRWSSF